jgi:hypothetical protein
MKTITGLVLASACLLQADTLYLRDGRVIQGTFISGNSRELRFLADGGRTQRHLITSVERIAFADSGATTTSSTSSSSSRMGASTSSGTSSRTRTAANEIPAGTVVTVRMIDSIDSNQTDVGRRYAASLDEPLVVDGRTVAPRGADATVEVVRVDQSGTIQGREEIALALTEIVANGRRLTPQTQHAEVAAKSRSRESATVIGGTAVVGAIIGAIAGGGKGAAIGAASGAGAGAAVQAIRGQRIQVPSESRLDFTLAQPMRF